MHRGTRCYGSNTPLNSNGVPGHLRSTAWYVSVPTPQIGSPGCPSKGPDTPKFVYIKCAYMRPSPPGLAFLCAYGLLNAGTRRCDATTFIPSDAHRVGAITHSTGSRWCLTLDFDAFIPRFGIVVFLQKCFSRCCTVGKLYLQKAYMGGPGSGLRFLPKSQESGRTGLRSRQLHHGTAGQPFCWRNDAPQKRRRACFSQCVDRR
jgi:hypothetical protein